MRGLLMKVDIRERFLRVPKLYNELEWVEELATTKSMLNIPKTNTNRYKFGCLVRVRWTEMEAEVYMLLSIIVII